METALESKIVELKKNMDYRSGSIVSKIIREDSESSFTFFAFDRGQAIFPRTASVDAEIRILEGKAEVMVGGKNYDLEEGEKIVMPKSLPHALFAKTKLKLTLYKG